MIEVHSASLTCIYETYTRTNTKIQGDFAGLLAPVSAARSSREQPVKSTFMEELILPPSKKTWLGASVTRYPAEEQH